MAHPENSLLIAPENAETYKDFTVLRPQAEIIIPPGVNARYLDRADPETQRAYLKQFRELGVKVIRILLTDDIERDFGQFNFAELDRIVKFGELIKQEIPGGGLIIPLIDFFSMKNRNWAGGSVKAGCIYQKNRGKSSQEIDEGLDHFYQDQTSKDHFKKRCEAIMGYFIEQGLPVFAWEIANEPEWPGHNEQFSAWIGEIATLIANLDPNRLILPGVARPWDLVGENLGISAYTAHIYPDNLNLGEFFRFFENCKQPVMIEEIGMFSEVFGLEFNLDQWFSEFLRFIFEHSIQVNWDTKTIILRFSSLYIWQISHQKDMFTFHPDQMPKTVAMFKMINEILGRV